jgi:hypothetical protein
MDEAENPQPDAPKSDKHKRRWFQFSLRSLLIATVICAVACGWLGKKVEQKRDERDAVQAIVKLGGGVQYDYQQGSGGTPHGPAWLRKLLGDDFLSHVERVDFIGRSEVVGGTGGGVTDDDLAHLKALPQLKELGLALTPRITDAGLEHLKGLTELNYIALGETGVTDAGMANLKGLAQLEHLFMGGNKIGDAGLANLRGLTQLRELSVKEDKVTDAGLTNLEPLVHLQYLSLYGDNFTDAGLQHLAGLNELCSLTVTSKRVSDAGLIQLKRLFHLKKVYLKGSLVTDAGLQHLRLDRKITSAFCGRGLG